MDFNKYVHLPEDDSFELLHSRLTPVFDYIEKNYQKVIGIEDMAAILDISPQHLCHVFKKVLNCRPFEYLNFLRINKSKTMMFKNRKLKIREVAESCGYHDTSYFCSVFRKLLVKTIAIQFACRCLTIGRPTT